MHNDIIYLKLDLCGGRTRAEIQANITKINALIALLLDTAIKSVANGNVVEMQLDTGQTKTNVTYSDVSAITRAIKNYEEIRQLYVNMLNPRMVRLVNSKTFTRRRG